MHGVPPLLFAAIRFTAVVLPAVFLVPRPAASWRAVALVGLFMSLGQFSLLYGSIAAGMSPGLAGLVLQAQVVFTILIAAGALREVPSAYQLAGVAIGTGGVSAGLAAALRQRLEGLIPADLGARARALFAARDRLHGPGAGSADAHRLHHRPDVAHRALSLTQGYRHGQGRWRRVGSPTASCRFTDRVVGS